MPWLKLYTEIVDDPKLADFTGDEFRVFVYLLCLAREADTPGVIDMGLERLAWRTRRPPDSIAVTLQKCVTKGMVELTGHTDVTPLIRDITRDFRRVTLLNFGSRQGIKPSDLKEKTRDRKRRSRERSRQGHASSRPLEVEEEEDTEEVPARVPPMGDVTPPVTPEPRVTGIVGKAYEEVFGHLLADKELRALRSWLNRGISPERIAEAIRAVGAADRSTIRSRFGAVMCLLRDTQPHEPMEWGGALHKSKGLTAADLRKLSEDLARASGPALPAPERTP